MRLVAVIALLMWLQGCIPQDPSRITVEKYEQIQKGMTYEQVKEVLHSDGNPIVPWNSSGGSVVKFEDSYGSSIVIQFQDSKVNVITPALKE